MLAAKTRSGLVETLHDGAVAVVSAEGELIGWAGDIDRPFFLRSAAKPFQAAVAQEAGALLRPVELAVAAGSHDGHPVHLALVESMLHTVGLDDSNLRCPPSWPLSRAAERRLARDGHLEPRRLWHTCSGKHAAWLRAAQAQDWPIEGYLAPDHPIQRRIVELVSDLGQHRADPVGIDGCGAPVLRTTTRVMALLFARLAHHHQSLRQVFVSMHRYPALVSGSEHGEAVIASTMNAAAKRGADGCMGVALENRLGIAVKSWDGLETVADVGAAAALVGLGEQSRHIAEQIAAIGRPKVMGGDVQVGELEPRVEMRWS
ncbi:MAG TPA: asparaginase [Acidimicrobiia bacterium]|nr:asparaginase [Acidimicrobiia bacterium]